jgi:Fe-S cluster biogenesis protein NfuA
MNNHHDLQRSLERIETLVRETEELADPAARARVQDIVQALLEYYGAGLERIVELITHHGSPKLMELLTADKLVSSLLLLHEIHPLDLPDRIERALDDVRPFLQSHGGEVELVGITDGVVRLQMRGNCHGCPSSAVTMKTKIEQAILEAAPDIVRVELAESDHHSGLAATGFVPLATLTGVNGKQ